MERVRIALVVAFDCNRVIGVDGGLPWKLPADLRRFRSITMGKPILMGRRTHASIGRALPGRTNIVLTRNTEYEAPGCLTVPDFATALEQASTLHSELMIIGGASIYAMTMPYAERIYLTEVQARLHGDTYFPDYDVEDWLEVDRELHPADAENHFNHAFVILDRKTSVMRNIAVQH